MDWLSYIVAGLFFLCGAGCVVLVALQLPGIWIMLALAGLIEYLDRFYLADPREWTFGWQILVAAVVLAAVSELIEFFAGVLGARHGGASTRGMVGALIGGIAGIFVFTPLFFFLPIFGSLLGAILGTFVGAVLGELTAEQRSLRSSMKPALGATIGRVVGTTSKVGIAIVLWLVLSITAFWR